MSSIDATNTTEIENDIEQLVDGMKRSIDTITNQVTKIDICGKITFYCVKEDSECYNFHDWLNPGTQVGKSNSKTRWFTPQVQNRIVDSLESYMNAGMNPAYGSFKIIVDQYNNLFLTDVRFYCTYIMKYTSHVEITQINSRVSTSNSTILSGNNNIVSINAHLRSGVFYYMNNFVPTKDVSVNKICTIKESFESWAYSISDADLAKIVRNCSAPVNQHKFEILCDSVVSESSRVPTRIHTMSVKYTPIAVVTTAYRALNAYITAKAVTDSIPVANSTDAILTEFQEAFLRDIELKFTTAVANREFYISKNSQGIILYKSKSDDQLGGLSVQSAICLLNLKNNMFIEASNRINNMCSIELKKVNVEFINCIDAGHCGIVAIFK
jgi:hypothetical protein